MCGVDLHYTAEEAKPEPISMDIDAIMKVLPHRYPFLLVDRVTELVSGDYAHGYKNVTVNDNFFPGHFPGRPLMPGVLQVHQPKLPVAPYASYPDHRLPGASLGVVVTRNRGAPRLAGCACDENAV